MIYLGTYFLFVVIVALASLNKRIGFVKSMLISIFLTPFVGLLVVLKTHSNIVLRRYIKTQACADCGNEISINEKTCKQCGYKAESFYSAPLVSVS